MQHGVNGNNSINEQRNTIKALAFDLDGTLIDSLPGLTEALNQALTASGLTAVSDNYVKIWIGNGADRLIARALQYAGQQADEISIARMRKKFDHFYASSALNGSQLYPHVLSTLKCLQQANLPLALVTNKPTAFLLPLLSSLGIANFFQLIIGGDDCVQRKPHPAPIYWVLAKFGLYASQLLFVGDSANDIDAAKSAGCPTVGLSYGYNYGQSIALSQPTYLLDDFSALLPILKLI